MFPSTVQQTKRIDYFIVAIISINHHHRRFNRRRTDAILLTQSTHFYAIVCNIAPNTYHEYKW